MSDVRYDPILRNREERLLLRVVEGNQEGQGKGSRNAPLLYYHCKKHKKEPSEDFSLNAQSNVHDTSLLNDYLFNFKSLSAT